MIAGFSTALPPICSPSKATAMWNGSRATTPITRRTRSGGSASRPTSRTASNTSASPESERCAALNLSGRAHVVRALAKIGDQGPDVVVVLRKKGPEILLLRDGEIESGDHDIDNVVAAVAAIHPEIDLDRLLSLPGMRVDQHRAHQLIARRAFIRTGHPQSLAAIFGELGAIYRECV